MIFIHLSTGRNLGTPAIECIGFESGLTHGLNCGNLTSLPASDHSLEIVRQGSRFAASVLALRLGDGDTFALALEDVLAFELCDGCEYSEHEFAGGRCRVDGLLAAYKFHLFFG